MDFKHAHLTSNSFMKGITIIYFAMLIGMLLFGGVVLLLTSPWEMGMPPSDEVFLYIVPIFTFLGVLLGRVIFKLKMDKLKNEESLKQKLLGLQTAVIIKFALVEAPYLLGVVATLLTGNIFYLMISGTLVMYFITLKPTREKVKRDLNLSLNVSLRFNDRNQIIN